MIIKLLEENKGKKLLDIGLGNVLYIYISIYLSVSIYVCMYVCIHILT